VELRDPAVSARSALSAAQAFRAIADDGEPGWADEARGRAEPAEQRSKEFQTRFETARQAGKALVNAGTLVPIDLVQAPKGGGNDVKR